MKNGLALMCAAAAVLSANAADYTANLPEGDPLLQWDFNWKDGEALDRNTAGGQKEYVWNGAILPSLPTLEDSFTIIAGGTTDDMPLVFRTWPWDMGESNTMYAKSIDITTNSGRFYANGNNATTYLEVAQDVKIDATARGISYGTAFAFMPANHECISFQRITIGGNLEVKLQADSFDNVFFVTSPIEKYAYSADDPSLIVGGQVKFNNGNRWMANNGTNGSDLERPVDMWAQVGGIDGRDLRVSANNPSTRSFNLVFKSDGKTPFTGGVWSGAMTSFWGSDTATAHIIMDGGADGGMQTIRFADYEFGEHDLAMATQTLDMKSGKLSLGTGAVTKFTEINMIGGKLYVDDESYEGFTTDVLNLNGGQLIFDAWSGESEYITAGEINGSQTDIIINLNADDFYIGMEVDSMAFEMFRGTENADWDTLLKCIKFMIDGQEVTLAHYAFVSQLGNTSLEISGLISEVPEPAAIAAIIGAFALAFAARRRRK